MAILRRRIHNRVCQYLLLAVGIVVLPAVALAGQPLEQGFPLRNQNPFLQIFGLPAFQSATLATKGAPEHYLSLDIANHADAGSNPTEDFVIDGETYFLTLSSRHRLSNRLELGFDVPLVAHQDGFLDQAIENWHDAFGMSNSKRHGPSNQLDFSYSGDGVIGYDLGSPSFGLGDIHLTAAMLIRESAGDGDLDVALRATIKLPTGDTNRLLGSGATDLAIGAYIASTGTLWNRALRVSGFAGALMLGEGNILSEIQRSALPYGGIAATWQATERFAIATQLSTQGAYFDSAIEELGGDSLQLAVGGYYRLRGRESTLGFAIVEDVSANATTDVALHFAVRINGEG